MPPLSGFVRSPPGSRPASIISSKMRNVSERIRNKLCTVTTTVNEPIPRKTSFPNLNQTISEPKKSRFAAMTGVFNSRPTSLPALATPNTTNIDQWRRTFRRDPSMQRLWADMRAQGQQTPWDPTWKRALDRVMIPVEDAASRAWSTLNDVGEEVFIFSVVGLGVWGLGNVGRAGIWTVEKKEDLAERDHPHAEIKTELSSSTLLNNTSSSSDAGSLPPPPRRQIRHKRTFSAPINSTHLDKDLAAYLNQARKPICYRPTSLRSQPLSHTLTNSNPARDRHLASVASTIRPVYLHNSRSTPAPSLNYLRLRHARKHSQATTEYTSTSTMALLETATTSDISLRDEWRLVIGMNSVEDILGGRRVPGMVKSRDLFPAAFDRDGCFVAAVN